MRYLRLKEFLVFMILWRSTLGQSTTQVTCGSYSCNGYSYSDLVTYQQRCQNTSGQLTYCKITSTTAQWSPVVNSSILNYIPCHGNFYFTIVTGKYWLNDIQLLKWNGTAWNPVESWENAYYPAYLGRLRPNEGNGSFYCYVGISYFTPSLSQAFYTTNYTAVFYNGTYYNLATDVVGNLVTVAQTMPHYTQYRVRPFVTQNETGCASPGCFWTQDAVNTTGTSTTTYYEVMYNGSQWYTWTSGAYKVYSGEFTSGIIGVVRYFSTYKWTISNGTKYQFVNGSVYQLSTSGQPTGSALVNWDNTGIVTADASSTGGYYYFSTVVNTWGMYRNSTGTYWCNIKNGVLSIQPQPPPCIWGDVPIGRANPPCSVPTYAVEVNPPAVCDLNQSPSSCGDGYICTNMASLFNMSCFKGICVPDFKNYCAAGSTSTTTPLTTLQKFGGTCTQATDCYTGVCANSICSCTNCTKILAGFDWSWPQNALVYREMCIPTSSTVGGLGDVCDMWSDPKQRACGMGAYCTKCPEVMSSSYTNATCVGVKLPSTNSGACPTTPPPCSYLASCTMIAGTPTCTCPAGYNLESNMKDCYGWKVLNQSACSVTCGSGVQQITRTCDKNSQSTATCSGDSVITASCLTSTQCPVPASSLSAAVLIQISSSVITPALFDNMLKSSIANLIANALNSLCLSNSTAFQNQCCPGKVWSSSITTMDCVSATNGISFMSEYSNGTVFSFYVAATGNPSSTCCSSASAKTKRSTNSGGIDQSFLVTVISNPSVLSSMTQTVQNVDPYAAISTGSISIATTTLATASAAKSSSNSAAFATEPTMGNMLLITLIAVLLATL